jgi:hypothetical protein
MQLRYVGGLSEVGLPGVAGSVGPGGVLDVEDEDRAARAVASGEWEPADDTPVPKRRERVSPAPQKG